MVVGRVGAGAIRQARRVRPRARPLGALEVPEALEALLDQQEEPNLGVAVALVALVARVALVEPRGEWLRIIR